MYHSSNSVHDVYIWWREEQQASSQWTDVDRAVPSTHGLCLLCTDDDSVQQQWIQESRKGGRRRVIQTRDVLTDHAIEHRRRQGQ